MDGHVVMNNKCSDMLSAAMAVAGGTGAKAQLQHLRAFALLACHHATRVAPCRSTIGRVSECRVPNFVRPAMENIGAHCITLPAPCRMQAGAPPHPSRPPPAVIQAAVADTMLKQRH